VLVDKFGLCWCIDLPPVLTCASQVLLRIPSFTTTTTNSQIRIFQIWLFHRFLVDSYYLLRHCDVCWMSFKFPLYPNHHQQKTRRTLLTKRKGLKSWLDLHCVKEKTPPFSKPLPDRIPQQQQWLYLSCPLSNYSLLHQPVR
jgi:hypothetical protein